MPKGRSIQYWKPNFWIYSSNRHGGHRISNEVQSIKFNLYVKWIFTKTAFSRYSDVVLAQHRACVGRRALQLTVKTVSVSTAQELPFTHLPCVQIAPLWSEAPRPRTSRSPACRNTWWVDDYLSSLPLIVLVLSSRTWNAWDPGGRKRNQRKERKSLTIIWRKCLE